MSNNPPVYPSSAVEKQSLAPVQPAKPSRARAWLQKVWDAAWMPLLALVTAFAIGAVVIWITSGSFQTVIEAYSGMFRGAFVKQRGLSETIVATTPYIFLSLAVALGFKAGLFNIGVEGQFYIGAVCVAFVGYALRGLPAIIHLPLAILAGALGGAGWAAIPGYLKARTGAHEVINTIMMNYIAFRLVEYLISGPIKDKNSSAVQTPTIARSAQLWAMAEIPERLKDPLNALGVALVLALVALLFARWLFDRPAWRKRERIQRHRRIYTFGFGAVIGAIAFFLIPLLTRIWWPFNDPYDRLHIGFILALMAAVFVWWLLWKTITGFELRTVGANTNAARYAGMNITRNIVLTMSLSGALAGIAGAIEVLGVSTLPLPAAVLFQRVWLRQHRDRPAG